MSYQSRSSAINDVLSMMLMTDAEGNKIDEDAMDAFVASLPVDDKRRAMMDEIKENLTSPHDEHRFIAAVNLRVVMLEEQWGKCINCGEPFVIKDDSTSSCSDHCSRELIALLM